MALIPQVPLKEPSSVSRNIVVKALLIGLLALLLLIPTAMVMGIISDRESRRDEAVTDITNKWGKQQTLLGPVLSVPYTAYITEQKDGKTVTIEVQRYANFLPAQLNIKSSLAPEKRYRSIFEVVVYNAATHAEGYFGNLDFASLNVKPEDIDLKGAVLTVGISDLTGIDKSVLLDWNTQKIPFNAGSGNRDVVATGIHTPVPISSLDTSKQNLHFAFDLQLKGSDKLAFTPVGKVTDVQMTAPWATPSFDGNFLPDDRKVTDKDFTAHWNVLHLNRNYPQQWQGDGSTPDGNSITQEMKTSAFGVSLLIPNNNYNQANRSIKYAILFIALTFMIFFFVEILNQKRVHLFQYILVGLALVLFYTLLVSISEYLPFGAAYMVSSGATIVLISLYVYAILDSKRLAGLVGGTLFMLYGFIFVLLQLEDLSLLIGSIGLFIVLAIIMYYSRKIDWYNINDKKENAA